MKLEKYIEMFEYLDKLTERNRKEMYKAIDEKDYHVAEQKLGANIQISEIRKSLMEIAYEDRV